MATLNNSELCGVNKVRDAIDWLDGFANVFTTWRRRSLHRDYVENHLVEWAELVGRVLNASVSGEKGGQIPEGEQECGKTGKIPEVSHLCSRDTSDPVRYEPSARPTATF